MALTRIKTNNILDREVREQDLADGAVTFDKINIVSGGSAGHVLKTDGSGNLYWELATGASSSLDTLTDVDISTQPPVVGETLAWDGVNWVPQSAASSNPGNLYLANITDVNTSPRAENNFLRYDGFGTWRASNVRAEWVDNLAAVGLTNSIFSLANVDDVTLPTNGQVLQWNGTKFVAANPSGLSSIDELNDVDTSTTPPVGGQVLAWNGVSLQWEPLTVGGVGASSNTYVVNDIAARDALTVAEGDSCFVRSGVSGEYEMYVWDAAWILLATQDSARTDANTIDTGALGHPHGNIFWNDTTPVTIGNISDGSRVTTVTIEIITPFDGDIASLPLATPPAFFSIGDDGNNGRLFIDDSTNGTVDWLTPGTYVCTVDYTYDGTEVAGTADTDIKAYFNFSGPATTGEARVIVTHV